MIGGRLGATSWGAPWAAAAGRAWAPNHFWCPGPSLIDGHPWRWWRQAGRLLRQALGTQLIGFSCLAGAGDALACFLAPERGGTHCTRLDCPIAAVDAGTRMCLHRRRPVAPCAWQGGAACGQPRPASALPHFCPPRRTLACGNSKRAALMAELPNKEIKKVHTHPSCCGPAATSFVWCAVLGPALRRHVQGDAARQPQPAASASPVARQSVRWSARELALQADHP